MPNIKVEITDLSNGKGSTSYDIRIPCTRELEYDEFIAVVDTIFVEALKFTYPEYSDLVKKEWKLFH